MARGSASTRVVDQHVGQLAVLGEQLAQGREGRLGRVYILLRRCFAF